MKEDTYYNGRIIKVHKDQLHYDIKYDDDEVEKDVLERYIDVRKDEHIEDDDDDDPNFSPKKNASPGLNVATIVYSSSVPNGKTGDESKKKKEAVLLVEEEESNEVRAETMEWSDSMEDYASILL